jgi:hypothetical protein
VDDKEERQSREYDDSLPRGPAHHPSMTHPRRARNGTTIGSYRFGSLASTPTMGANSLCGSDWYQ